MNYNSRCQYYASPQQSLVAIDAVLSIGVDDECTDRHDQEMPRAANLLIGSTCGTVYIARCDPNDESVVLKTTITAGRAPIQLLVDVPNKCFYCLDAGDEEEEGRLLTLAPTPEGTIDEMTSIGTGGKNPLHMMNVGKNIFITHKDGYSIVESPIAPKSTRRRRTSTLAPVTENTVAESLDQLYSISKAMGPDAITDDPAPAIAAIEAHLYSETQAAVTELQSFVTTKKQILKFVDWSAGGEFVVGITHDSVTTYTVKSDGRLMMLKTMPLNNVVDCEAGQESLFVLCEGQLLQGRVIDGELSLERTVELDTNDAISLRVLRNDRRAFVMTTSSIISIELDSAEQTVFEVIGTSMTLSNDNRVLFVADGEAHSLSMYSLDGRLMGECMVSSPADIVQMS